MVVRVNESESSGYGASREMSPGDFEPARPRTTHLRRRAIYRGWPGVHPAVLPDPCFAFRKSRAV